MINKKARQKRTPQQQAAFDQYRQLLKSKIAPKLTYSKTDIANGSLIRNSDPRSTLGYLANPQEGALSSQLNISEVLRQSQNDRNQKHMDPSKRVSIEPTYSYIGRFCNNPTPPNNNNLDSTDNISATIQAKKQQQENYTIQSQQFVSSFSQINPQNKRLYEYSDRRLPSNFDSSHHSSKLEKSRVGLKQKKIQQSSKKSNMSRDLEKPPAVSLDDVLAFVSSSALVGISYHTQPHLSSPSILMTRGSLAPDLRSIISQKKYQQDDESNKIYRRSVKLLEFLTTVSQTMRDFVLLQSDQSCSSSILRKSTRNPHATKEQLQQELLRERQQQDTAKAQIQKPSGVANISNTPLINNHIQTPPSQRFTFSGNDEEYDLQDRKLVQSPPKTDNNQQFYHLSTQNPNCFSVSKLQPSQQVRMFEDSSRQKNSQNQIGLQQDQTPPSLSSSQVQKFDGLIQRKKKLSCNKKQRVHTQIFSDNINDSRLFNGPLSPETRNQTHNTHLQNYCIRIHAEDQNKPRANTLTSQPQNYRKQAASSAFIHSKDNEQVNLANYISQQTERPRDRTISDYLRPKTNLQVSHEVDIVHSPNRNLQHSRLSRESIEKIEQQLTQISSELKVIKEKQNHTEKSISDMKIDQLQTEIKLLDGRYQKTPETRTIQIELRRTHKIPAVEEGLRKRSISRSSSSKAAKVVEFGKKVNKINSLANGSGSRLIVIDRDSKNVNRSTMGVSIGESDIKKRTTKLEKPKKGFD